MLATEPGDLAESMSHAERSPVGLGLPPLRDPGTDALISVTDPLKTRVVNAMLQPLAALAAKGLHRKIDAAREIQRRRLQQEAGRPVQLTFWNGIPDIVTMRPEEELDFLEHRSPMYVPRLSYGVTSQLARWLTGQQQYEPASDETMAHMLLYSPVSHALRYREIDGEPCFLLDLTSQKTIARSTRATFNVNLVAVGIHAREGKRALFIQLDDGVMYSPAHADWSLAKFYFQISWAHATVGMSHTWVHFAFPNAVAALLENLALEGRIDRQGTLCKLLWPHIRFTMRINHQALHESKFSARSVPSLKFSLTPWTSLPIDTEAFVGNIARLTKSYYFNDADPASVFPPRFDERKPYDRFTKAYWDQIHAFVSIVAAAMDDEEYAALADALADFLPDVKRTTREDLLATLIWQTAVVHSVDHYSAYQYARFGVPMATRPFSAAGGRTPDQLTSGWSLMRWRNASSAFIGNLDDNPLDIGTETTDYGFSDAALRAANARFRGGLIDLDTQLAVEGRQICPLRYMVRSVCY